MDHSREIRQLWFFANSYFEEAKELKIRNCGHLDITLTAIMDFYKNGIPTEIYRKELSLSVAHLDSAAIRLCTINERFRSDEKREIMKDYFAEFRKRRGELSKKELWTSNYSEMEFRKNITQYMPQMLRDNVVHIERAEDKRYGVIWEARQNVIESLKVIEVFNCMQSAIELFQTNLRNSKIGL